MARLDVAAELRNNRWILPPFGEYLKAEQGADRLRVVGSTLLLPGLVQTDSIATAINSTIGDVNPADITAQVSMRLRRHRIHEELSGGLHLILPEDSITSNPMGADRNARRHQVDDLITFAERDGVSIRVLPNGLYSAPGYAVDEATGPSGTTVYTETVPGPGEAPEAHVYHPGDPKVTEYAHIIDACSIAAMGEAASRDFLKQAWADIDR
jgi:hypothetical protein